MDTLIWIGIIVCISQSAILSGSNLALFSVSKLRLELEAAQHDRAAQRVLGLRADANFLLVTILWGNVAVNVLLALLANSVLTGVMAFLFSTVIITMVGEILPQAYFTRHATQMGAFLAPLLRVYQWLLYPVARPTAWLLDAWLGPEGPGYFKEADLRDLIELHGAASGTDIDRVEARGARNFLDLDDLPLAAEGEVVDPNSIVSLEFQGNRPVFPRVEDRVDDPFLQDIQRSGRKWIILLDEQRQPRMVLNAATFLRDRLFGSGVFNPYAHCHRPILVQDGCTPLGEIIPRFKVHPASAEDDVIDEDIILLWGEHRRIITGSDLLGRLLRGIARIMAPSRS